MLAGRAPGRPKPARIPAVARRAYPLGEGLHQRGESGSRLIVTPVAVTRMSPGR